MASPAWSDGNGTGIRLPSPDSKSSPPPPPSPPPGEPNGGQFTATLYPGPRKNWVFNASTIWWGDGLSEPPGYLRPKVYTEPKGPDARVQRLTSNLLARMLGE